jgi:PAS domain S-box-containing protein
MADEVTQTILILVADEDARLRKKIRKLLEGHDRSFRVLEAENRNDFLQNLAETELDLIISDIGIFQFKGLDFVQAIRRLSPKTPFVILTDKGSEEIAIRAFHLGCSDYILKRNKDLNRLPRQLEKVLKKAYIEKEENALQEKLTGSEMKFRSLFDYSNDAIFIMDLWGNIIDVNRRACKMYGYSKEEFLRLHAQQLIAPEDLDDVVDFDKLWDTSGTISEWTHLKKDGSSFSAEVSARIIQYADQKVIQGIVRDVSRRKLAETEIQEKSKELQALYRIVSGFARHMDEDSILRDSVREILPLLRIGRGFCILRGEENAPHRMVAQHGISKARFEDRTIRAFCEALLRRASVAGITTRITSAEAQANDRKALRELETVVLFSVPIKSKREILGLLALCTHKEIQLPEGKLNLLNTIGHQLAVAVENIRLYQHLKKSELRYRSLMECANDAIFLCNPESFTIVETNRKAAELWDQPMDTLVGKQLWEIFSAENKAVLKGVLQSISEETPTKPMELGAKKADGSKFPFELSGQVLDIAGVQIMLISGQDITDRKNLQEQLLQSEKLFTVGQLVSGVAHEINNPLCGIVGYVQLLGMRKDLGEDVLADLEKITRSTNRAKRIVENLLAFARKYKPERKYMDINETIESILELRAHDLRMANIKILKELDPSLPRIFADRHQLQQVFINIINNAHEAIAEAHREGSLTIKSEVKEDKILLHFTNSGPGIPGAILRKVFDPFFTTKPIGEGTGLGLSIAYGIVKAHEGNIYAKSDQGKGTTFTVELPILRDEGECLQENLSQ